MTLPTEAEPPQTRQVTFICHASENKAAVKNLADTLMRRKIDVWYDAYEIKPGDSIRSQINEGLRKASYGVVVLSHEFFEKRWTKDELGALWARLDEGTLIPVYLNITPEEVADRDPLLSDRRGIVIDDTSKTENVNAAAALITDKIFGTVTRDEHGRKIYLRRTIDITALPRDGHGTLEGAVFEQCVIQGPAVLIVHSVLFEDCIFNAPEVFFRLSPEPWIGMIGLDGIIFRECRFKDISFGMYKDEMLEAARALSHAPPDFQLPDYLG